MFDLDAIGPPKALLVAVATRMAMFGTTIQDFLTNDVNGVITAVVSTGRDDPPERQIDDALGWMQVAMSSIDAIRVIDDQA